MPDFAAAYMEIWMILLFASDHCLIADETAFTFLMWGKQSNREKENKKNVFKISFSFEHCKKRWFLQLTFGNGISLSRTF